MGVDGGTMVTDTIDVFEIDACLDDPRYYFQYEHRPSAATRAILFYLLSESVTLNGIIMICYGSMGICWHYSGRWVSLEVNVDPEWEADKRDRLSVKRNGLIDPFGITWVHPVTPL